jgi:Rad3-related DNA helicase
MPVENTTHWLVGRVLADLCQGGTLSSQLPGYKERPAQLTMATHVATALTTGKPAIIEAGTGVGKSLAYLIPTIRSGQTALVSTANKALQEQIYRKDIPFLQRFLPFEAALVKGISNYVCIDRVQNARTDPLVNEQPTFQRLRHALERPECTGDLETLGISLPIDLRLRVNGDQEQCAWKKCEFFDACYIRKMREKARAAQIIVINHTLLLLDAVLENALLPDRDVIVLDEAHHLEEEATAAFTQTMKPGQFVSLLQLHSIREQTPADVQEEIKALATALWLHVEHLPFGPGNKILLTSPLPEVPALSARIDDLGNALRERRPPDQSEKETALYDKLILRTDTLARTIRQIGSVEHPEAQVYYAERIPGERGASLQVCAAPLTVSTWLKEKLFDRTPVIMASATLATQTTAPFAYFRSRVGLSDMEVEACVLPLAFDYQKNALLYIPRHVLEPLYGATLAARTYVSMIAEEMRQLVIASRGRAFLLFSSRRMLEDVYALLAPQLSYPLLKQGMMSNHELTRCFREEQGAVLFGLKSFWEGVDIAGEALSLVVIDKLPFNQPDDPIQEARVKRMKDNGEDWFGSYVLPQVIMQLKQGVGRLLRTQEDRGVMAILDTRLHSKGYGRRVIAALPPATRTAQMADVQRFFSA